MQRIATLEIPQDILESAHMSMDEIKLELALHLYAQGKLSSGKARELAGLSLWQFRQMLAVRRIEPHYDEAALEEDITTLQNLGRL